MLIRGAHTKVTLAAAKKAAASAAKLRAEQEKRDALRRQQEIVQARRKDECRDRGGCDLRGPIVCSGGSWGKNCLHCWTFYAMTQQQVTDAIKSWEKGNER